MAEALSVRDALAGPLARLAADVMIAPPATLIAAFAGAVAGAPRLLLAGQDCHAKPRRRPHRAILPRKC